MNETPREKGLCQAEGEEELVIKSDARPQSHHVNRLVEKLDDVITGQPSNQQSEEEVPVAAVFQGVDDIAGVYSKRRTR